MRTWSEKNGRADIMVHGFTWIDNVIVTLAGVIVLSASILVLAVMP